MESPLPSRSSARLPTERALLTNRTRNEDPILGWNLRVTRENEAEHFRSVRDLDSDRLERMAVVRTDMSDPFQDVHKGRSAGHCLSVDLNPHVCRKTIKLTEKPLPKSRLI